jgi:hypothetical protein
MDFPFAISIRAACVWLMLSGSAGAVTVTIDPPSPINGITWTVTPSDFLHAAYYGANPKPQSSAAIDTLLSGWFGLSLTSVAQADYCGANGLKCTNDKHTLTYDGPAANVFGIHIGKGEFAFYYSQPITELVLTLVGGGGISNIRTYCSLGDCTVLKEGGTPTPLPGALPMFGAVLGGGWLVNRWRKRRKAAEAEKIPA